MGWRLPVVVVTVWLMTVMPFAASPADDAAQSAAETSRELRLRALDLAYNLDHDQAIESCDGQSRSPPTIRLRTDR
jgi:hypothetical protein